MNRSGLFVLAFASLASLGPIGCNRSDQVSETSTTSATQEPTVDPNSLPPVGVDNSGALPPATPLASNKDGGHVMSSKDGGHVESSKDGGHYDSTGAMGHDAGVWQQPAPRTGTLPIDDSVAPGHIVTPPGAGRAKGAPNSEGSHNIGAH